VCVRVFIGMSARICMSICVCAGFLKKKYHISEYKKKGREVLHQIRCHAGNEIL
jgi:hypothetical protein